MTPLVLLPGMMCDARLFSPQLAELGRNRAIHLAPITEFASMAELAADVLRHAPARFALAGLSMGGIVAMEVLAQQPDRVTHVALIDTNPCAELPDMRMRRGPQIDKVRAGGLREVMRDEMKPNYLARSDRSQPVLKLCMDMAMGLGPAVFERQSIALRDRPDRRETLRGVRVPTLIMCGRHDRLCPVERHEMMHALIPGSRLEIIEGCGHLPTLEQPEESSRALAQWLEE